MTKKAKANAIVAPALDQTAQITAIVAAVLAQMNGGHIAVPQAAASASSASSVVPQAAASVARPVSAPASAKVETKAPEGICAHVGNGKHAQVKLPSALFDGYSRIVLTFPNGVEKAVDVDSEGRARMTVKQACELSGAHVGQYLKFEPTHAGYFAVNVVNGVPKDEVKTNGASPRPVVAVPVPVVVAHIPVAPASRFGAMFSTFGAVAHTEKQASKTEARANDKRRTSKRTPAQKAATERMLAAKAAKKAAKESGVVTDAGQKRTPRYVTPDAMPKSARSIPVPNVGAAQTAFANGQKAQTKADAIINAVTGKGAAYVVPSRKS